VPSSEPRFRIGVDLGQAQDFTAIAIAECRGHVLHIHHIERLPLGTSYPDIVSRITGLAKALRAPYRLILDATGVGRPVLDLMRQEGLQPVTVSITGGSKACHKDGIWRVPKQELVRGLVSAFEQAARPTFEGAGEHADLVIASALVVLGRCQLSTQLRTWIRQRLDGQK
jgi:hypothetical protein